VAYNPSSYALLGSTTYVSGEISDLISNDGVYMVFKSYESATSSAVYNPSAYTLLGSTTYVSGGINNLTQNDGVYLVFESYKTLVMTPHNGTINGAQ